MFPQSATPHFPYTCIGVPIYITDIDLWRTRCNGGAFTSRGEVGACTSTWLSTTRVARAGCSALSSTRLALRGECGTSVSVERPLHRSRSPPMAHASRRGTRRGRQVSPASPVFPHLPPSITTSSFSIDHTPLLWLIILWLIIPSFDSRSRRGSRTPLRCVRS